MRAKRNHRGVGSKWPNSAFALGRAKIYSRFGANIADDSEVNADGFIDKIYETMELLARQPGMGRHREEVAPGIQSFPVGRYLIFYRTVHGALEIVRVLHGARDIENVFEG